MRFMIWTPSLVQLLTVYDLSRGNCLASTGSSAWTIPTYTQMSIFRISVHGAKENHLLLCRSFPEIGRLQCEQQSTYLRITFTTLNRERQL